MKWSHHNPPDLTDWSSFFSQVVCVERHGTKQFFVAGQVGVDAQKRLAGTEDLRRRQSRPDVEHGT